MFFLHCVNTFINRCVIFNPALILYVGFENAACQSVGTHCKYFHVGGGAVLIRNIFTTAGHGKGNGLPSITVGDREQDEVMNLKDLNTDCSCYYCILKKQSRPADIWWTIKA
jgi:hypothetical protein